MSLSFCLVIKTPHCQEPKFVKMEHMLELSYNNMNSILPFFTWENLGELHRSALFVEINRKPSAISTERAIYQIFCIYFKYCTIAQCGIRLQIELNSRHLQVQSIEIGRHSNILLY